VENFYASEGLRKRKYAKPTANRRNNRTRIQPARDITLGSIPTKKETPKQTALKIKRESVTPLWAPSSIPPASQLSKPGTISVAPRSCPSRFILALGFTAEPTVKPKRLRIVLGASNNPAAKTSITIACTINKLRNLNIRKLLSTLLKVVYRIQLSKLSFKPHRINRAFKIDNVTQNCAIMPVNMEKEIRFANDNNNNDNNDPRIVGRSLGG
jgi:hypothetical protein